MLNEKQLDIGEKVLINMANVVSASLMFGSLLRPQGFSLKLFVIGVTLFSSSVVNAMWLRREKK